MIYACALTGLNAISMPILKRRRVLGDVIPGQGIVWDDKNIFVSDVYEPGSPSRADTLPEGIQLTTDNVYEILDIPDFRITAQDITDMDRREDNLDRLRSIEAATEAAAQAATSLCR